MRAAQLATEYNFDADKLMRFFNWEEMSTARHYARLSSRALADAMFRGQAFTTFWDSKSKEEI